MKDLDLLAARTAQEIITNTKSQKPGEVDNLITKALGVLQENGVYAALLYLYSRSSSAHRAVAKQARESLLAMLSELGLEKPSVEPKMALKFMADKVCDNLDRLLLVKQLWEQTLIYTRYGAKARETEDKDREEKNKRKEVEVKA